MARRVGIPVLAGLAVATATVSARDARAEGAPCPRTEVAADASIQARWPELAEQVRDAFGSREDVDRCARVVLTTTTAQGGRIGVEVALRDGRSAQRLVSRREDVIPALEALLIVPQAPARDLTSAPSATAAVTESAVASRPVDAALPNPGSEAAPIVPTSVRDMPAATPAQPPSHLRIELSALTGARIGDGQAGVGVGALSFLDVTGWLVGFAGRLDRYAMLGGGHAGGALELAVLGGRRWRFGTTALDLVAGPSVALGGQSSYETSTAVAPGAQTSSPSTAIRAASASNTVTRLLVEARLAFFARSTVHTFVAVDGDFGSANSPDASELPDAPRLPTWTAGLALGATVGMP